MRKKSTPFAISGTTPYVKMKYSGIHPLIVFTELTQTTFGNEKTVYLNVSDVIEWHEKELSESGGQSGNPVILQSPKRALAMIAEGKVDEQ